MFYSVTFKNKMSINTITNLPEVLHNAIILSSATLVYFDNDRLNVYARSLDIWKLGGGHFEHVLR